MFSSLIERYPFSKETKENFIEIERSMHLYNHAYTETSFKKNKEISTTEQKIISLALTFWKTHKKLNLEWALRYAYLQVTPPHLLSENDKKWLIALHQWKNQSNPKTLAELLKTAQVDK